MKPSHPATELRGINQSEDHDSLDIGLPPDPVYSRFSARPNTLLLTLAMPF
jgi:hypothetical protein